MNTQYLALLLASLMTLASRVAAKPIWEIASVWRCSQAIQTEVSLDGSTQDSDILSARVLQMDFNKNSIVGVWDQAHYGKIYPKFYIENSVIGNQSVYMVDWDEFGDHAGIIIEKSKFFWTSNTTGYENGNKKLSTSHSRCHPVK